MPTYRILRKIVDYHLKEEERKVDHQICERINSPNPENGTGQKT